MMAQFVSRLREWHSLRALPAPVGAFYRDALALARANDDIFSLGSVSRPTHLATLLELARGRTTLVELGTCTAWTSIALALHEPAARVLTFDPVVHAQRERYLALVAPEVRGRIALIAEPGADGAHRADAVELLFIDATHERAPTVAEFRAWRPRLAAGAIVVFDDYGHPDYSGVAEAVADLGLTGEVRGALFVTRADGSG
jgi:predicted O-methyltransferase YrrM